MWDLTESVPDHCLPFYFTRTDQLLIYVYELHRNLERGLWSRQNGLIPQ